MPQITAVILASGNGSRFGRPKQFALLAGLPLLIRTLLPFQQNQLVTSIVIVTREADCHQVEDMLVSHHMDKVIRVIPGGASRQESSRLGVNGCPVNSDFVLIHDGARPLVSAALLQRLITALHTYPAVNTVINTADTIIELDTGNFIKSIPDRNRLRRCQTPQGFRYQLIKEAHEYAERHGLREITDDCGLVLAMGGRVFTIAGEETNIKITYEQDLQIAERLLDNG
ncbi:MAG TPA: 2-C-methyl-D-erythritol 4-phosphate cytidylyltransferase [Desulfobacterales bacterium]|nr:2-C-methyl-D-erythritol 4-phosphate cytidylyltransferase [Desulfobacterales bacterium]